MRVLKASLLTLLGVAAAVLVWFQGQAVPVQVRTWQGPPQTIAGPYRSMSGPLQTELLSLDSKSSEIAWITAFGAQSLDPQTATANDQRYQCHTNLVFPGSDAVSRRHGQDKYLRLFTISQGQKEVRFPPGFGVPIRLDTPLMIIHQVLNEKALPQPVQVQQVANIEYVSQAELKAPLKPLFGRLVSILRELEKEPPAQGGELSLVGGDGCGLISAQNPAIRTRDGKFLAAHWTIPPGTFTYRQEITIGLDLPYDTTLHAAALHVHPYCRWVELRDKTTDKSLLKLRIERENGTSHATLVESYQSVEGIPLFKDHKYELISLYDNDSGETQDAMINLFLFLHDKTFQAESFAQSSM